MTQNGFGVCFDFVLLAADLMGTQYEVASFDLRAKKKDI